MLLVNKIKRLLHKGESNRIIEYNELFGFGDRLLAGSAGKKSTATLFRLDAANKYLITEYFSSIFFKYIEQMIR